MTSRIENLCVRLWWSTSLDLIIVNWFELNFDFWLLYTIAYLFQKSTRWIFFPRELEKDMIDKVIVNIDILILVSKIFHLSISCDGLLLKLPMQTNISIIFELYIIYIIYKYILSVSFLCR